MKILIAPDSFKNSLTAMEAAESIEKGILKVYPDADIHKLPMADGGEGTVQSLIDATGGRKKYKEVLGPLGHSVKAYYGLLGDNRTAVIEMATASGLPLVPREKADPRKTTTYGTGQLIKAVLDEDIKKIIIGIGGSATNDAGVGMAQALGIKFMDANGKEIGHGGSELCKIKKIDMTGLDKRIEDVDIKVACDVSNPLHGPDGASYIYGPQKGATPNIVKELDDNLRYFADIVKEKLNINLQGIPGAGAAGGLGAGLVVFLDAELESGIDIILKASKLEDYLPNVDLVITGEGRIDEQSLNGKTPIGIARKAKEYNLPVIGIAGSLGQKASLVLDEGIDSIFSIIPHPIDLDNALQHASEWLELTAEYIMRVYFMQNA
ncbi:MAG: glycerate kinase [Halothermotrichaceae bacterium]